MTTYTGTILADLTTLTITATKPAGVNWRGSDMTQIGTLMNTTVPNHPTITQLSAATANLSPAIVEANISNLNSGTLTIQVAHGTETKSYVVTLTRAQ